MTCYNWQIPERLISFEASFENKALASLALQQYLLLRRAYHAVSFLISKYEKLAKSWNRPTF